ncbi:MAG: outer membrane beta-barrel protein, partial [Flavisolibacter sp.]
MKKISFIVFALSMGLATFAQNENVTPMAVKPRFGIKAGVNMAKLRPSDYSTNEPQTNFKSSFNAGALVNIPLGTGGFAVQPEAIYSRQGSKMKQTTTVGTVTTTNS